MDLFSSAGQLADLPPPEVPPEDLVSGLFQQANCLVDEPNYLFTSANRITKSQIMLS